MNEVLLSLLDHLPTAIAVITDKGQLLYQNRAFAAIFGSEAERWMKTGARSVAGERGWVEGFFSADGVDLIDLDFSGRTYRIRRVPTPGMTDKDTVALEFEDVTRQREIEQAKSDFTSMIVHDLRGPLSGIQGTLELVLSDDNSRLDPLYEDLLQEASHESERMMNLINELLDFSKIQSGNFTVEAEPVPIAGVLKRSVRSLLSVASRDEILLVSGHASDLPQISGSAEKLTQAIINLVSNSLKFTPKKGVISVGAQLVRGEKQGDAIVITVTDSGMGIRADELPRIWEKYQQSGTKSLRGGGGTGLGLYIVKQVVEAHGGMISVASVEGIGTSMVLRIPLKRAA